MSTHLPIGRLGESLAATWLEERGYTILHRNYCFGRKELDLIACKSNTLHFIEVKTRRSKNFGYPEQQVTAKKIRHMKIVAEAYLHAHTNWQRVQYDILAILLEAGAAKVFFFEDIS